jgi:urea transport system permease protein
MSKLAATASNKAVKRFWQPELIGIVLLIAAMFIAPYVLVDDYLISKFSRYLVFGMLAAALSWSWGYGGILNLGQALPFGLGSYCMAMALKLRTIPVQTGSDGLPDFMVWNNVEKLPWFWQPFYSMTFAIIAGIVLPAALMAALGWFMFRGRVTGVFVAITTLAMLVVVNLVIIDQQQYTGGFNGITDLAQLTIGGVVFDAYSRTTFYLIAFVASLGLLAGYVLSRTKFGLILQAIRDQEGRVQYFGYDVASYKIAVMAISAAIAGLAGMLYTIVMEFASPTFLSVPLSLSVVIWCAVGGRNSLPGAFIGAVLVTGMQGALSESKTFLDTWTLVMGALFVLVVLFLPSGLSGLIGLAFAKIRRIGKRRPIATVDEKADVSERAA